MADFSVTGLRVLCEVASRGSFTAAAGSLGYTQSAVSRQVAVLEAAAGARLFERAPRGVRLTDAGNTLLVHAAGVLEQLDSARRELTGLRVLASGRLRVGAFPTAIAALLPRTLAAFGASYPGVTLSLREGTTPSQLRRLAAGASELAVVGVPPSELLDREHLTLEPLLEDPLLLALARAHPLARRRVVDLADLADEQWVTASTDPAEMLLGVWPALGWQPRIAFIAREWTAKLGLVAAGLGVTVVPGLAASAVREDVALVRVRSVPPVQRRVAIATRAGTDLPPQARVFADILHDVARTLEVELQRRLEDR